ncbi:MAG: hypothetical protein QNI99_10045 [Woeseiaceae bacterium]|nr:hypothetical protein [Woeseiaceae bacterium]
MAALVAGTTLFNSAVASDFEEADSLSAANTLPADVVRGQHHRVQETVLNDGYLNYYTIDSDYGEFEAVGALMLLRRIGEIEALAELDELSKTQAFIEGAADAGIQQIRTVRELATNPVETVVGIPSGIGRMFRRWGRQAQEAIDTAAEVASEVGSDGDGRVEVEVGALTESYFDVDSAQMAWHHKLGTDPYTDNETLQAAIKEYAWAERLGSVGIRFTGAAQIPGMDIIAAVYDVVWSTDPYELEQLNKERLAATGADEALIDQYLDNPHMTPTHKTLLTAAIAELEGVWGRDGILRQALNAESHAEADFFINSVTMLAWYHRNEVPIEAVATSEVLPAAMLTDGSSMFAFAVDHVYWTEDIADAGERYRALTSGEYGDTRKVLLLGTASERCRNELTERGFEVRENLGAEIWRDVGRSRD